MVRVTIVPAVLGCTVAKADNYDSSADTDDGSCTYCSTFALSIDSQSDASASGASDGTGCSFRFWWYCTIQLQLAS